MRKKVILIITDGIGYNPDCKYNAFCNATKPTYDYLFENVPYSLIKTYGLSVGLPEGQMGNSEVGHMTLGSGRILYQDLVKINLAIKNNSLKENQVLKEVLNKSNNIHLIGLVSNGGVHSHINHIIALAKIAKSFGKKVYIHAITDGRDVDRDSAKKYIKQLLEICDEDIILATIAGRFWTMDRDKRWERVERGYRVIENGELRCSKAELHNEVRTIEDGGILGYIDSQYEKEIFDEFIEPVVVGKYPGLNENDGVIFCNFRSDRMREISRAIADNNFSEFKTKKIKLNIATMTEYDKNFPLPILFPKEIPTNTLAEVISKNGLTQLHTAETEKYAHVTFFFNGGIEDMHKNEDRILIDSPKVKTYDLQPQMSAPKVSKVVRDGIEKGYDFIVVNFANGDMVGHTGNYEAAVKAVEAVDKEIGLILQKAKEKNYSVILTSDHGNCEKMRDKEGNILTNHTVGDVFCFVIDEDVKEVKNGGLNNIASTILLLMGLPIPKEMDEALIGF